MRFDAVIFDLDGTLADTLDDIADSMNAALLGLGQPTHSREMYRRLVGEGVEKLARQALPEEEAALVPRAVARFREHYAQHLVDHTRLFPQIDAMLDGLVERKLQLGILSNKIDAMTKRIGERCFGRWPFAHVLGEREGIPRKPDPTSALELAERMRVSPERILFVGDTAIDMQTAANAGMYAVGVLWGFRDRAELESNGARTILSEPLELLSLL